MRHLFSVSRFKPLSHPIFSATKFKPLSHSSYIELFYDLVFVYCMNRIIPVAAGADGVVGWYDYYTFSFVFLLMLQVWFNSATLMNRFGHDGRLDALCLVVNMFLLLAMTEGISTDWSNYLVYNIAWILLDANLVVHWLLRLRLTESPSLQDIAFVVRVVGALGIQMVLVLVSLPFVGVVGQVLCFLAFVAGAFAWSRKQGGQWGEANAEHLVDRCALLVIIAFGEMIKGIADSLGEACTLLDAAFFLALSLGMFLVYVNQIENVVDRTKLGSGMGYMGVMAWLTFCVGNVTAAFEMSAHGAALGVISGEMFFAIAICVFLMSFLFLLPMTRDTGRIRRGWLAGRIAACLVAVVCSVTVSGRAASLDDAGFASFYVALAITVLAIYVVLIIDGHMYRLK